jgi:hypothetical protein
MHLHPVDGAVYRVGSGEAAWTLPISRMKGMTARLLRSGAYA